MPQTKVSPRFEHLRSWLNEIEGEKSAAARNGSTKEAEGRGKTTHPASKLDNGTMDAGEGARSSENSKDVKSLVQAGGIDSAPESRPDRQDEVQYNLGLNQSAVGEDSKTEDDYKDRPGQEARNPTSHPASSKLGPKYSSADDLHKAASALSELGNELLAAFAVGNGLAPANGKSAAAPAPAAVAPTTPSVPASPAPQATESERLKAAQEGYEVAALLGLSKEAADKVANEVIEGIIYRALNSADKVGALLVNEMAAAQEAANKQAAYDNPGPGGDEGRDEEGAVDEVADEGDEGAGGGDAAVAPTATPMPVAAGGGAEGGSPDDALQDLAAALIELGITPEELAAAAAAGGGGMPGEGGGLPVGGGLPPGAAGLPVGGGAPVLPGSPAEVGAKLASAVKDFKRSGKFEIRAAKNAAERQRRNEMKGYVLEILGATRR